MWRGLLFFGATRPGSVLIGEECDGLEVELGEAGGDDAVLVEAEVGGGGEGVEGEPLEVEGFHPSATGSPSMGRAKVRARECWREVDAVGACRGRGVGKYWKAM